MIKINLLPVRAAKKKETTRQQISILVITIIGTIAICGCLYSLLFSKILTAKDDAAKKEQEIVQLKTKIGEIDNIKKLQAEVKKKLDVLDRLRKEKNGPLKRLALLTDSVPEKLWLTKYSESSGAVSLSGLAFSEDEIAAFMKSLQSISDFSNIELQVSEQTEVAKTKVKKFDVTFKLAAYSSLETENKGKNKK